ncbi:uncharacterized protein [Dysidea avara]|uniref:uncharacterized protein isoform X2 n=1 Tax=Dysidea avara TaxID=196820 RepID=UPI0033198A4F
MEKISSNVMSLKNNVTLASAAVTAGDSTRGLLATGTTSPISLASGALPSIAVETLLPSPPPLKPIGPVEITANLESSSSTSLSSSSDSSYSLSSSYADDNVGLEKFMLTSELHATTTQDSVKSDHSYFKTSEPSSSKDIDGADEQSKRKKGRPRKYHIDSPSSNSSSKMSSKMQTTLDKKTISVNHNNKQGNASKKVTVTPSKRPQAGRQRSRYLNCGNCVNCCKEDCGKCLSCKDKPKFGGNNTRKQRCVERICLHKPLSEYAKFATQRKSTEKSSPASQTTLDKSQLSYAARKRSLSQLNQSSSAGDSTPEKRPAKIAKMSSPKVVIPKLTPKSKEATPATPERSSARVAKLSTSTTVVSSSSSKVTMTTSEKKEYSMRTSSRRDSKKVDENSELEELLANAPPTLRKQLAINMNMPSGVKKEPESPFKTITYSSETSPSEDSMSTPSKKSIQKTPTVSKSTTPTTTTATSTTKSTQSSATKEKESTPASTIETSSTVTQPSISIPVTEMSGLFPNNVTDNDVTADSTVITLPCLAGGSDVEQWSISDVEKFLTDAKYQQYTTLFQQQHTLTTMLKIMDDVAFSTCCIFMIHRT